MEDEQDGSPDDFLQQASQQSDDFDPDGEEIDPDGDEDADGDEGADDDAESPVSDPAPAPVDAAPAPSTYRPPVNLSGNPFMDTLSEQLGSDLAGTLVQAVRFEQQRSNQAATLAGGTLAQAAQAAPDWYNENRVEIAATLASLPPEQQATPAGAAVAFLSPILRRIQETGDVEGVIRDLGKKLVGTQGLAPSAPPAKPAPLTSAQRIPSPGSGGGGSGPAPRRSAGGAGTGLKGSIIDTFGVSEGLANDLVSSSTGRKGWGRR